MNRRLAHLLTHLYPRRWRERFGAEFEELLLSGSGGLRTTVNVVRSAIREHIFPTRGRAMDQQPNSFIAIMKHPSAFLPLAMSLTAIGMLLGDLAIYGISHEVHQPDEGTVAHLWQILMAGQLPIIAFFAIKWLPRAPRQAFYALAIQAGAVLASMAPVFFLGL
jgi:hypothetical protein